MSSDAPAAPPLEAVLAFDTSTEHMSVAVVRGERVWTHEGAGGVQASARLLPAIFALLGEAGLALADLDAIAFGQGPGAFTGLRTTCSVAQGLALGAGKPVLALDTLMAVAEDARQQHATAALWVAMDARMDEVYAAHYAWADGRWSTLAAPALYGLEALNARWQAQPPRAVAGNAIAAFGARLRTGAALLLPDALPRALALASLARAAWAAGAAADASAALPLYLRDKVALTTAERDAVKAAKSAPVQA
jgi:tRNA threonylcarbamoyladenosine biosynthesis protein TsaB